MCQQVVHRLKVGKRVPKMSVASGTQPVIVVDALLGLGVAVIVRSPTSTPSNL
jgi:hypothetical protein